MCGRKISIYCYKGKAKVIGVTLLLYVRNKRNILLMGASFCLSKIDVHPLLIALYLCVAPKMTNQFSQKFLGIFTRDILCKFLTRTPALIGVIKQNKNAEFYIIFEYKYSKSIMLLIVEKRNIRANIKNNVKKNIYHNII